MASAGEEDRHQRHRLRRGVRLPLEPEYYYRFDRFGVRRNARARPRALRRTVALFSSRWARIQSTVSGELHRECGACEGSRPRRPLKEALNLNHGILGPALANRPSDTTSERPIGDAMTILP